jgi:hypothetical protein
MVPLLIDENFHHRILRGLRRHLPALNYLLVQDTDASQQNDAAVLDWAVAHNRVVIMHDVNTMTKHAYTRLEAGQPLPGMIILPKELAIGRAIEELVMLLTCSHPEEFPNRVIHLPL